METLVMGWVDRANRCFLNAIKQYRASGGRSGNTVPLPLSPALIDHLESLHLASHDGFIGETLVLWGTLLGGAPTAIDETDPGWRATCDALERSGRLQTPIYLAELELMADPRRKPHRLIGEVGSATTELKVNHPLA